MGDRPAHRSAGAGVPKADSAVVSVGSDHQAIITEFQRSHVVVVSQPRADRFGRRNVNNPRGTAQTTHHERSPARSEGKRRRPPFVGQLGRLLRSVANLPYMGAVLGSSRQNGPAVRAKRDGYDPGLVPHRLPGGKTRLAGAARRPVPPAKNLQIWVRPLPELLARAELSPHAFKRPGQRRPAGRHQCRHQGNCRQWCTPSSGQHRRQDHRTLTPARQHLLPDARRRRHCDDRHRSRSNPRSSTSRPCLPRGSAPP